jgi:hypothetical protein
MQIQRYGITGGIVLFALSFHRIMLNYVKTNNLNIFCRHYAETFYSDESSEDEPGVYFFNAGEIAVQLDNFQTITEEEYLF